MFSRCGEGRIYNVRRARRAQHAAALCERRAGRHDIVDQQDAPAVKSGGPFRLVGAGDVCPPPGRISHGRLGGRIARLAQQADRLQAEPLCDLAAQKLRLVIPARAPPPAADRRPGERVEAARELIFDRMRHPRAVDGRVMRRAAEFEAQKRLAQRALIVKADRARLREPHLRRGAVILRKRVEAARAHRPLLLQQLSADHALRRVQQIQQPRKQLHALRLSLQPELQPAVAPLAAVIAGHGGDDVLIADDDQKLPRPRDRRVQNASGQQHLRPAAQAEHDRAVFAALALVDGHGVGRFKLREHVEAVFRRFFIELDGHGLLLEIDLRDAADIAVEDPGPRAETIRPFPHYIIVIPDLHYPIADPEGKISVFFLFFPVRGRVEHGLQRQIQGLRARLVLPAGAEHLNVRGRDAHVFGQPRLQSYVITHATKFLKSLGRNIVGWDEILEGGLADGATVMSWRGESGGIAAAKQNHDVIMTPNTYLYFDYYQSLDKANEPEAIGGYLPLERVYSYEPMPKELTSEEARHIIGVQANIWTEYMPTFKQMQYMALPRLAALSEVQWSQPELKNYKDFACRLIDLAQHYEQLGYNYAKHMYNVAINVDSDTKWQEDVVRLTTAGNAEIRYTLDGSMPTMSSALYTGPMHLQKSADIRAAAFRNGKRSNVISQSISFNKATTCPVTLLQPTHKSYTYEGATVLTDGIIGDAAYSTGRWLGFCGNDLEAVIDLKKPTDFSEVGFNTCVEKGSWVFDARGIEVSVSQDGKTFTTVATKALPAMEEKDANKIYNHQIDFTPTKARYIKVLVKSEHSIPAWHGGKGKPGFLFVDEICVK